METTDELKSLISAFKGYRDLLSPIQVSLHELSDTYDSVESDLEKLGATLNGNTKERLDQIYDTLSNQAKKSTDLASSIDQFVKNSNKYTSDVTNLYKSFEEITNRINTVNELENKAKEQIQKLESIIEEKKINYNIRDLQKILENYNNNVQKVSDFINKDVAQVLAENNRKIDSIKKENEDILKQLESENTSVNQLAETFQSTNSMLKNIVQKEDVNEEYIYAILDKWANERKIKIKK